MPTMRIRRYWPSESRLGRLAMDLASSVSVPLSAVPPEISRLVLESLMPPAPSRRSTVGRRSVDESLLVPLRAFFSLRIAGFTSTDLLLVIGKQWTTTGGLSETSCLVDPAFCESEIQERIGAPCAKRANGA